METDNYMNVAGRANEWDIADFIWNVMSLRDVSRFLGAHDRYLQGIAILFLGEPGLLDISVSYIKIYEISTLVRSVEFPFFYSRIREVLTQYSLLVC